MDILFIAKEAGCMNALEKFYTYLVTTRNNQRSDNFTIKESSFFYTVI